MTEKINAVLSDPAAEPDDEFISQFLGNKIVWWRTIMADTISRYKDVTPLWRYYNDGKQWLFRLMQKKDTIFWLSLADDTFRITFYLPDKAEVLVEAADIPEEVKAEFRHGKHYGKIRGITIRMISEEDVDTVLKLVALKLKIK